MFRNREEYDRAPVPDIFVRLFNDGPGTAVDVCVRLRSTSGDWTSAQEPDAVRALRPGGSSDPLSVPAASRG